MKYSAEKLKSFAGQIMRAAGMDSDSSEIFADSLITADMRGIGSHGISRLKAYSNRISRGVIAVGVSPKILEDNGSLLLVDAQHGAGSVMASKVMDICIQRASENGCCFAAVKGGNHFGCSSFFTEQAAKNNMVGIAMANAPASMAPIGGKKSVLGTNPLSVAVPATKRPLILDMATSVVARGKVTLAAKEGRAIPKGWGLDAMGVMTEDPREVKSVLPFGGAKGFGIALIIEIFCSCLSGAMNGTTMGSMYDYSKTQDSGFFIGAFNIGGIMPIDQFKASVDSLSDLIKNSERADGIDEIYLPGEIEYNNADTASKKGISLSDSIISELCELSDKYNVPFECAI